LDIELLRELSAYTIR